MIRPEVIRKRFNKLDDYLDIDRTIVYDVLQAHTRLQETGAGTGLADLYALRKVFARFL